MRRNRPPRSAQRGAALILAVAVLIVGVAWLAVGALGKAASGTADREIKTGLALRAAKNALLAHVAQYAARSDTDEPGQLPCPESLSLASPGTASGSCSNLLGATGRLPWKTLGIDQIRDGDGEPLWYVISPGFRSPPINFGKLGLLTYNGAASAAVALIIAPGRPLPIGGCVAVNQQVATRNATPLVAGNFLECGNELGGGAGDYANPALVPQANDRVIAITAAEWADAIAGPVADRLQREVAPALADWFASQSADWGPSFFPYASVFSDPSAANNLCGTFDQKEGVIPAAGAAAGTCDTAWESGSASLLLGLSFSGCTPQLTGMRCQFLTLVSLLFGGHVSVVAPNVSGSFRSKLSAGDITVTATCLLPMLCSATALNPVYSITAAGKGKLDFDLSLPLLQVASIVTVDIKNLQDAPVLSDARLAWFLNNNWQRHTYYAVSPGVTAVPDPLLPCVNAGDAGCLTVTGLAASTGNANDKRLVLALMGRRLATQLTTCATLGDCLEGENASTGDRIFASAPVSSTFNDRIAACPYKNVNHTGTDVVLCN